MSLRRELTWLTAALLCGAVAMPLLAYFAGVALLGPYSRGGAGVFLADFASDLAQLRWYSWAMALAPFAVLYLWRLLWRLTSRKRKD